MVKNVSLLLFVVFLSANVTAYAAEQRGQPPRPAVKCVIRDLDVKPGTLHKDERIESFTVNYRCEHGDRKGVNIEIAIVGGPHGRQTIAVLRDTILKMGDHRITLKGTSNFYGSVGRFITTLKSGGGMEFHKHESNLNCVEWGVQNLVRRETEYYCLINRLYLDPTVLRRGTKLKSFKVDYTCKRDTPPNSDIEIKMGSESHYDTVAIMRDISLRQGNHRVTLSGTGTYKGEGGNFKTVLHGAAGDTYLTPIRCSGWGIK